MNDILKVINDLKKSQSEVLAQISKISKPQTSQFAELKKDLISLFINLILIKAKNTSLWIIYLL